MNNFTHHLEKKLQEQRKKNLFRELTTNFNQIDFCSNDYLGLAQSKQIHIETEKIINKFSYLNGSTGSRLISGNNPLFEIVENKITEFLNGDAGLIFNSGFDANIGFFSTIPKRNDTIIYDEFIHASIRDGIRLSNAKSYSFKHNNIIDLKNKLNKSKGNIFIAVESIYSMDGDEAPMIMINELCEKNGYHLIIDEAHSTGIAGDNQFDICTKLGINPFARLHTFGKVMGCHGAIWITSKIIKEYLINFCRAFIYTTALPNNILATALASFNFLYKEDRLLNILQKKIELFKNEIKDSNLNRYFIQSYSPIQSIILPGNDRVIHVSNQLTQNGFAVKAIRKPTVKEGKERIRFSIHAFNSDHEIKELIKCLKSTI